MVAVGGDSHERELPVDFCLREVLETSPTEVVTLMNEFGLLARPHNPLGSLPERGLPDGVRRSANLTVAVCEHHLRVLRSLSNAVIARDLGDRERMATCFSDEGLYQPATEWDARAWWQLHVNAALRAFPMYVAFDEDERLRTAQPTLYEVAVLQLVQLASGGFHVQRCGNDRCRRPFTRQRTPRRQYAGGEHQSGVRYCSRQCAKAQSERDRRARRKEEGK
ncbi:hypothetical protein [uncultured Nocardioides sp.]|uniref:hypothetical protein n=1 Tax=uncultured Nocardioides sp. TaxID=198441 RepID=UPI002628EE89|nr:hypothetical protein [uncultured Nocardioides sp.]